MPTVYEYLYHYGYYIKANIQGFVTFQVTKAGEVYIEKNFLNIKRKISKSELYTMYEKRFIYTTGVPNIDSQENYLIHLNRYQNDTVNYSKIDFHNGERYSKDEFSILMLKDISQNKSKNEIQINKNIIKPKESKKTLILYMDIIKNNNYIPCPICQINIKEENQIKHIKKLHHDVEIIFTAKETNTNITICKFCGVKILTKNFDKHNRNIHPNNHARVNNDLIDKNNLNKYNSIAVNHSSKINNINITCYTKHKPYSGDGFLNNDPERYKNF